MAGFLVGEQEPRRKTCRGCFQALRASAAPVLQGVMRGYRCWGMRALLSVGVGTHYPPPSSGWAASRRGAEDNVSCLTTFSSRK